jgi:folate-binding protein YgfZ
MTIKPNDHAAWRGGVLDVHGRDALAFLHAQLMSDVRELVDGRWQWSGWLSAKGRVIALGLLQRLDGERLRWWLPDHPAAELAQKLQRFVFRSKVTLEARDDLVIRGAWGVVADGIAIPGERPRALVLGDVPEPADPDAWAVQDLAIGLPRLPPESIESHTPQMLGLDALAAYSVKKGCYPGQEIVARTHFLGQAKRRLQRLQGDVPFAAGEALALDGKSVGEVLCAASSGQRHEAQAVLPIDLPGDALARAEGRGEARRLPFVPAAAR